jgi:hypothetical protein
MKEGRKEGKERKGKERRKEGRKGKEGRKVLTKSAKVGIKWNEWKGRKQ